MSDMKCPVCSWCNQPMVLQDDIFVCANTDCSACAESFLHKALTQAKQDLEKLKERDSIREKKVLDWQMKMIVLNAKLGIAKSALIQIKSRLVISPELVAREALEQIEYKEDQ